MKALRPVLLAAGLDHQHLQLLDPAMADGSDGCMLAVDDMPGIADAGDDRHLVLAPVPFLDQLADELHRLRREVALIGGIDGALCRSSGSAFAIVGQI